MTDTAEPVKPNQKQLQAAAANAVMGGMSTSTEVIRFLKTTPLWISSSETQLKKSLEGFLDTFKDDIEPYPLRKRLFELDNAEDMLRGDLAQALEGLDLSDPRDARDIAQKHQQMLQNPSRGPHDIRAALDLLDNPEALVARFKALYPDPEADDEPAATPSAVPAVGDVPGATDAVSGD